MKIVSLKAENVKRLTAVEIRPDGALVEVSGANAQGKTSVLDSIWWALGGKKVVQSAPIRRGASEGCIVLDLGQYKVTRTFKAQDDGDFTTYLKVENADGATFGKPQDLLDAMVGDFSFDPLEFTRLKATEQVEALKRFVPSFDFAADAAADRADYDKRTEANREAKRLRAEASAIIVPEDAPEQLVDEGAILSLLRDAGRTNGEIEKHRTARAQETAAIERLGGEAQVKFDQAEQLRRRARDLESEATAISDQVLSRTNALRALPALPTMADTAALTIELEAARAANTAHGQAARRRVLTMGAEAQEATSRALTEALAERERARADAVAQADMPVAGLGFGDGQVTLNGLPFDQASDAEQLRTSIGIAAAMNPKLRVVRVRDGSRLDSRAMRVLGEYAAEHDLQVWVEVVESPRDTAVVIEDGRVAQPQLMAAE